MWWGMMEGGGAMEGRGCDVEYWRGETHLGSSLPVSMCCFLYPRVVSCVRVSFPVSTCHFPCLHVVSHVRTSLPVSAHRCPCPRVVARVHVLLPASVYVRGRLFSFVGAGGSLCWWAVVFVCGQWQCGGGELLVGSGESSGLALRVVAWPLWLRCGARWCVSRCATLF